MHKFTEAIRAGDHHALIALFAPDAAWTADGGGRTGAALHPILGADQIVTRVLGFRPQLIADNVTISLVDVNGETGLCIRTDGRVTGVLSFVTDGERIHAVYAVLNPDKL